MIALLTTLAGTTLMSAGLCLSDLIRVQLLPAVAAHMSSPRLG